MRIDEKSLKTEFISLQRNTYASSDEYLSFEELRESNLELGPLNIKVLSEDQESYSYKVNRLGIKDKISSGIFTRRGISDNFLFLVYPESFISKFNS